MIILFLLLVQCDMSHWFESHPGYDLAENAQAYNQTVHLLVRSSLANKVDFPAYNAKIKYLFLYAGYTNFSPGNRIADIKITDSEVTVFIARPTGKKMLGSPRSPWRLIQLDKIKKVNFYYTDLPK